MLIGIARLAAESPLLESKRQVQYFELPSRTLLNRVKKGMPFQWAINPYRGCEFACKYCYARYTHEFMGMEDGREFEDKIYAKGNVTQMLKRELRRVDRADAIAIGTATDPYQPAERRFERTRAILEILAGERGRHISIITKSDLITRDIAVLSEVARRSVLRVSFTITTLDTELARALEPRAPRPELRLNAVARLAQAGISVGVNANPIMPLITDSEENLDRLAAAVSRAGAQALGGGILFLMPSAQKVFFPFLEERFPHLVRRYRERFEKHPYLRGPYQQMIGERVKRIRARYGLSSYPADYQPELWAGEDQLELFPD